MELPNGLSPIALKLMINVVSAPPAGSGLLIVILTLTLNPFSASRQLVFVYSSVLMKFLLNYRQSSVVQDCVLTITLDRQGI